MDFMDRSLKCVVFIGIVNDLGDFIPYGTGFLLSIFYEELRFDYVVTCCHIINDFRSDKIWVRVNLKSGEADIIETKKSDWISDNKNDISILSHYFSQDKYNLTRTTEKDIATIKDRIKANLEPALYAGEKIYLVGLFTSHHGNIHNVPIVRIGHIATILDKQEPIYTDTGYVNAYLIETRSIGGLSGSPVFLYNRFSSYNVPWPIQDDWLESCILGMMRGRFNIKDETDVVAGDSPADALNTGIGIVVPIEIIVEVINSPQFINQREDTVNKLRKESMYRPTGTIPSPKNPQHKEDFNSLVSAATKKKKQED